jgi:single-strand DNA-binding protein
MSNGVNQAMLIGHLGADPELRATNTGQAVADLRMATSRKWKDKEGTLQEDTVWHRVVVWDKLATNCHRYLHKGSQVYVDGRIKNRKWVDKEGHDRTTTEIIARNVIFLGSPNRSEARPETSPESQRPDDPTRRW